MAKKSFDECLRSISAFKGWKDLVLSCKYHKYVPTLRYSLRDTGDEKQAISAVRRFLNRCGYRVYPEFGFYPSEDVCQKNVSLWRTSDDRNKSGSLRSFE